MGGFGRCNDGSGYALGLTTNLGPMCRCVGAMGVLQGAQIGCGCGIGGIYLTELRNIVQH